MALELVRRAIQQGKINPKEVVQTFWARSTAASHLNAFIHLPPYSNNSTHNGTSHLPMHGLPIGVKDNFCTDNMPTTCASRMLFNFKPKYNATVVQRLQQQGAVPLGKTNMDEFAMGCGSADSVSGAVRNPWNADFITGGSSGGSAAAVAAGLVLAALGSDTGGSTRNPAAHCGVVGLKPTYGAVSRYGLIPLVNALDVPGVIANSVDDCAEIFYYICGQDSMDSTTVQCSYSPDVVKKPTKPLRIGIPKEYVTSDTSQEVLAAWDRVAGLLDRQGHSVKTVSLPHTQYSIKCYSVLCCAEVASNMARFDGLRYGYRANQSTANSTEQLFAQSRAEAFNRVVRGRILAGNYFLLRQNYGKYYETAMKMWRLIHNDFQTVMTSEVDALLTPVTPSDALSLQEFQQLDNRSRTTLDDVFTQPANLAGLPAISVPVGMSSRQMPIGLQVITNKFQEPLLFSVAKLIEELSQFKTLFSVQSVLPNN